MANPSSNVIPSGPASAQQFFCLVRDKAEGPFDLIELAAQLRYANIDADTPIRREGEEEWLALRELSEFASVQEMSIETIARHLEEKSRSRPSPLSCTQIRPFLSSMTSIAMYLAGAAGLIIILALYQQAGTTPLAHLSGVNTPVPALWTKTEDDVFSVESPVPMNREDSTLTAISISSYRASMSGVNFTVDIYRIPDTIPEYKYDVLINGTRDKLINESNAKIFSQRFISVNGYRGLDAFFLEVSGGNKFDGGLRVLGGRGKLAVASVITKSGGLNSDDINRFLNSFQIR